ncbi:hypothetical protein FER63_23380 [Salmonella enterica]|nr:hypothetical protein [Salmonella enterica]
MPNASNLIPGHGRRKGSLNKETIERTEALRKYLLEKSAAFKILNVLLTRIELCPETIKTADLIKAFSTIVQPNLFYTIQEQETAERLEQILNLPPEQMKAEIYDFVNKLKAVG